MFAFVLKMAGNLMGLGDKSGVLCVALDKWSKALRRSDFDQVKVR
jgi:hypothetical protein